MVPHAESLLAGIELELPSAERPRAFWARARRGMKHFVTGGPEESLLAAATNHRGLTHFAAFGLLSLPVLCALLLEPADAIGRWTVLVAVITGLFVATRLELSRRTRIAPFTALLGGFFYAVVASGIVWLVFGQGALRIAPSHALAAVTVGICTLASWGDPRLCAFGGVFGALSVGSLAAFAPGETRGLAAALPDFVVVVGVCAASTLAAMRGRKLQRLAIADPASGALHAVAFARCLARAEERGRATGLPITLARIEVASLNEIRERHGPAFADALLRWLASLLADRFRATDLLGRTGPSEFSVALLDGDHPGIERRIEQLRDELAALELRKGGLRESIHVRVAYGIAALPREALDSGGVMKLAEQRLSLAKWRARRAS